ncbi:MAG: class IV adenylate cyclase [Phycisphaerae bacterium]|jgi:adenylate cyclase class IV|nr:class IV adenylate cyclase [Phycisphaerae bacterium]
MPHEIEAKFKVSDFRAIRRRLVGLGAVYLGTDLQTDVYYDTPDRGLLGEDKGLRIRRTRRLRSPSAADRDAIHSDTRALLTYKGPSGANDRAKIRREIQTRVDSPQALDEILTALGLTPTLTIQKKRIGYRLGSCTVELDELPIIGRFVEIEAPTTQRIEAVGRELRIKAEPSTDHYITLLSRACGHVSDTCLEITFDNCTDCKSA